MIATIFNSIQGEGKNIGTPTTFIRLWTKDCFPNKKKCSFCDTIFKKYYKENISWTEFYENYDLYNILDNVCITGGEPFSVLDDLHTLVEYLCADEKNIEIETNGAYFNNEMLGNDKFHSIMVIVDHINISPKLSNSNVDYEYDYFSINEIMRMYECVGEKNKVFFKFVAGNSNDMYEINSFIGQIWSSDNIYIMHKSPATKELKREIIEFCIENGYKYSGRLHEDIFDSNIDM